MKMNHLISIYNFGVCYEIGIGFEKDLIKAFEHYHLACSFNHP
jgi:TPR repeat protein